MVLVCIVGVVAYLVIALIMNKQELQTTLDSTSADLEATAEELTARTQELESTTEELHTTTQDLNDTTGELELVRDELASSESQLEATTEGLEHTEAVLDSTAQELGSTKEELDNTTHELTETSEELASTIDQLGVTTEELDTTTQELDATASKLDATAAELDSTAGMLASTAAELEATQDELEATSGRLASTSAQLDSTEQELAVTLAKRDVLDEQLRVIRVRVGSLEEVKTRLADIEALIEQREPLIPETGVRDFACTGSMEPKITCLDSARYLFNFDPNDIVVGSVIAFTPPEDCDLELEEGKNLVHRVIEVGEQDGVIAFRTKGGNSYSDDGCWITPDDILGYITALDKDTYSERERLGDAVNAARVSFDEAQRAFMEADYAYEDYADDWCYNYTCQSPYYQRALRLYKARQAAFDHWEKEHGTFQCWLDFAKSDVAYQGVWSLCGLTPSP